MQIRSKVAVAAAAAGLVALGAGVAEAAWLKSGSGAGTATAKSVGAASALSTDVTTSPGSVKLSWQAPTSSNSQTAVTGYQVLRYTASTGATGQTTVCSADLTSTATSCTDSSVTAGTTYYYTVAAVFTGSGGTAPGWVGPATSPRTSATPTSAVATATKLVFTTAPSGVQTASNTASIGAYVVTEEDASGNPVNAASDISVTLSTSSAGTTGKTPFFSTTQNGSASQSTTTVTITSGHSATSSFYYSDTKAASPTLTAHSSSLTDGTTSPTINSGGAQLGFGTACSAGGFTSSITIGNDAFGNPATYASPGTTFTVALSSATGDANHWTLGGNAGPTSLSVTATSSPTATFTVGHVDHASNKSATITISGPTGSGFTSVSCTLAT